MLVTLERIGCHQQHDRGEELPLQIEGGGRGYREELAAERIGGDEQSVREQSPAHDLSHGAVETVDRLREAQEHPHVHSPSVSRGYGRGVVAQWVTSLFLPAKHP